MPKIVLKYKNGNEATIDLIGATLTQLVLAQTNVIKYPLRKDSPQKGYPSALLFPFPNRVRDGRYTFKGQEYTLPINETEKQHAIHGLVAFEHFEVFEQSESKATLKYSYDGDNPGYPFLYDLFVHYILKDSELMLSVEVVNTGTKDMPCGFGWHPYFLFDGLRVGEIILEVPRRQRIELSDRYLPTGEMVLEENIELPLKNTILDTLYSLSEPDSAWNAIKMVLNEKKLVVSQKSGRNKLNYFILYSPPSRDCLAIEPMSCSTNAFNNGNGLIIIKPEKKVKFEISVKLEL